MLLPRTTTVRLSHHGPRLAALLVLACTGATAIAQLTEDDLEKLRERGQSEGWTFQVGPNPATSHNPGDLCRMQAPPPRPDRHWLRDDPPSEPLPSAFDWRDHDGCTPVQAQGDCGACWAFSTLAPLECNILIHDRVTVDLAEQWLINCNTFEDARTGLKYGCNGGWFAFDHLLNRPDTCGEIGAVLEMDLPYTEEEGSCSCPYTHLYTIDAWSYVANSNGVAPVDDIKQAIFSHGPIAASSYVDAAFLAYTGGVFNACTSGEPNHGILLVGWDDNQGTDGVWILRNSWGPEWGEDGYMRVEYGCSNVGYAACYVEYSGTTDPRILVTPTEIAFGNVGIGETASAELTVANIGGGTLAGDVSGLDGPFSMDPPISYSLAGAEQTTLVVHFNPTLSGSFSAAMQLTGGSGATVAISGTSSGSGVAADSCTDADAISDGTHRASNVAADTDATAGCGGGGTADVWWTYSPPFDGAATFDTSGSDFDTILSVLDECGGGELGCNNDDPEDPSLTTSRLTLSVERNASYKIRVAGRNGQTGDIVLNITTDRPNLLISGRITDGDGTGVEGVILSGLPGDPLTDADGYYAATVSYGFDAVIAPSKPGWTFDPPQRDYDDVTTSIPGANYVAELTTVTISGRVTSTAGEGLGRVVLNGLPGSVVTDTDGFYTANVGYGFDGSVTPQLTGYDFTPPSQAYEDVIGDLQSEDYVGQQQTGSLQITLAPEGTINDNAAWCVDGGSWMSSGATVSNLAAGSHRLQYAPVDGWSAPSQELVTIEADKTTTLAREYTRLRFTLTIDVQPAGAGSISLAPPPDADGKHDAGTVLTLTAVPEDGFKLSEWNGTGLLLETDGPSPTLTMVGDVTVQAVFTETPTSGDTSAPDPTLDPGLSAVACGGGGTCGAGVTAALPLTLLGLVGLKCRRARRSHPR